MSVIANKRRYKVILKGMSFSEACRRAAAVALFCVSCFMGWFCADGLGMGRSLRRESGAREKIPRMIPFYELDGIIRTGGDCHAVVV